MRSIAEIPSVLLMATVAAMLLSSGDVGVAAREIDGEDLFSTSPDKTLENRAGSDSLFGDVGTRSPLMVDSTRRPRYGRDRTTRHLQVETISDTTQNSRAGDKDDAENREQYIFESWMEYKVGFSIPTTPTTGPTPSTVVPPTPIPAMQTPTGAPNPSNIPSAPSIVTSMAPSIGGCVLPRNDAIKEKLSAVTDLKILDDPSTAQGQAMLWLQIEDPAKIDPCTYETVLQRYALATLYFSTDGNGWVDNTGWLSDKNECSWAYVDCIMVDEVRQVIRLSLGGNNLVGELPNEIHVLAEMNFLDVSSNLLSGSIPSIIFDSLMKLTSLRFNMNSISGTLPPNIDGLAESLEEFELSENHISGTIPSTIANLQKLETLLMATNQMEGSIPTEMGTMKLRSFSVSRNLLDGSIPEEFWANTHLTSLRLSNNQLSGTISSSIGNLRGMLLLDLSGNRLSGTVPILLGRASSLENLNLSNNLLIGTIRDTFGTFVNLQILDLSLNDFTGSIPSRIFDLNTIQSIALNGNNFDGTIPENLGNAIALKSLFLQDNDLTGPVPSIQKGGLASLEEFQLQDNNLTGSMAQSICNLRVKGTGVLEALSTDCGEIANPMLECIVPTCCTLCFPVEYQTG